MHAGTVEARQLKEWRCPRCNRLLAKVDLRDGCVEIKCHCNAFAQLNSEQSGGRRIPGSRVIF